MAKQVLLNEEVIEASNFKLLLVEKNGQNLHQLSFDFKVAHKDYHRITTLLYKQNFEVKVPESGLEFYGTIQKYWTSVTNLYEEDAVGDFSLELIEIQ